MKKFLSSRKNKKKERSSPKYPDTPPSPTPLLSPIPFQGFLSSPSSSGSSPRTPSPAEKKVNGKSLHDFLSIHFDFCSMEVMVATKNLSDFDTFLVGSKGFYYDATPPEQVELMNWALDHTTALLKEPNSKGSLAQG